MRTRIALVLAFAGAAFAQGTRADYARANALPRAARDKVKRIMGQPRWLPDNRSFWYRVDDEYVLVDAAKKRKQPLFDRERLAKAVGSVDFAGLEVDATHLYLWLKGETRVWSCHRETYAAKAIEPAKATRFRLKPAGPAARSRSRGGDSAVVFVNATADPVELMWIDFQGQLKSYGKLPAGETRRQHTFAGHAWAVRDDAGAVLQRFVAGLTPRIAYVDGTRAKPRPDRPRRVEFRNHNVVLDGRVLTTDGTAVDGFGGRVYWSPDKRRFVVLRTEAGQQRTIPIVDVAPRDRLQPRLRNIGYAKPGDRIDHPRPWLFDAKTGVGRPIDDALFSNPWSLSHFRWDLPSGRRFTFLYNQRGHQVLRLIAVDAATGTPRILIDEVSKTFLDYAGKLYLRHLGNTIVWMSERDGWNHLYRCDAETGVVRNQITKGAWAVRRVERINPRSKRIWFWAGGVRPGEDPYHLHLCRANLDGTGFKVLTEGDGTHTVDFSPDRRYFVDTWSRVDLPPVSVLRSAKDGALVCELERADWTGSRTPERFVAKGRDGKTDIHGVIYRPTNFDANRRYPVVEAIYAGPHAAHVPKAFRPFHGAQAMAELGFIVVQIDGMGTSHRSKAFHDVCWKNLGDAGFPDRIAWIRAAAKSRPQMDLTRVGIYGGSAGGQNAMRGLLAHGDFYKVGVADCGCHDNRMDKIWWNELWMGWPLGPHYKEQSNVTQAHLLTGKLQLIVGGLDANVDPASTMQVVDALVRANKDFDLVVIPGAGHGAAGTPYGRRRLRDFLVRHLHGVEPRSR